MKAKVIGIGAAGNKAAITLIEKGILIEQDVLLLNSTLKDIPGNYRHIAKQFSDQIGGCGKQRVLAQKLVAQAIFNGTLDFKGFLDPDDDTIIIVNSSEGGTGSGASAAVADYFKEMNINVHMFVFTGFEDDGRGLQNTVEYFQELSPAYTIEAISNRKFLDIAGTRQKAEKLANDSFAMRVSILLGQSIVDSSQNIDDTDLYKVATTPGFMMIDFIKLDKIKNVETFNKVVTEALDESKSLDISEASAKRLAVIFNISDKTAEHVDMQVNILRERLGSPYDFFIHIQNEGDLEYMAFIASGMKMPMDEIKEVYERYKESSNKVNKTEDDFFSMIGSLRGNMEDSVFDIDMEKRDIAAPTRKQEVSFFEKYGVDPGIDPKFKNVQMKEPQDKDKNTLNNF